MEQILISMVDEIKERRMTTYAEDSGVIEDLNYEFLVSELSEINKKLNQQLT